MFKEVGIVSKLDRKAALKLVATLKDHLRLRGVKPVLEAQLSTLIEGKSNSTPLDEMRVDFIITIGGDGTILRTCQAIPIPETPILAINMGQRGFLTEVKPEEATGAIDRTLKGDYILERCIKLSPSVGVAHLPDALNEVLIASEPLGKMVGLRVLKNSFPLVECYADGLVIATPTGSTAHSLSAGGPVVDPSLEAFILTPLSPMTPTRPLVVPAQGTLQLELFKPSRGRVLVDGVFQRRVAAKEVMTFSKSAHHATFIRFGEGFYRRLRGRLLYPQIPEEN